MTHKSFFSESIHGNKSSDPLNYDKNIYFSRVSSGKNKGKKSDYLLVKELYKLQNTLTLKNTAVMKRNTWIWIYHNVYNKPSNEKQTGWLCVLYDLNFVKIKQ